MKTRTATLLGGPVHYADFGGEGPPILLVHGLGGAHTNWMAVGSRLASSAAGYRVLAPDLIGFGRTPLAGRSPEVEAQVRILSAFIDEVAGGPAVVAGNSMGGLVSALLAASSPAQVSRLILVNAALPRPLRAPVDPVVAGLFAVYMTPLVGEAFMRRRSAALGPEKIMRATLRLCGVDPSSVPPEMYKASVDLAVERRDMPWADATFLRAARSLVWVNARRSRVHEELRRIRAPTLVIAGTADRLVPLAVGQDVARLRPDWHFEIFEGAGHTPQIEVPDRWIEAVTRFLSA